MRTLTNGTTIGLETARGGAGYPARLEDLGRAAPAALSWTARDADAVVGLSQRPTISFVGAHGPLIADGLGEMVRCLSDDGVAVGTCPASSLATAVASAAPGGRTPPFAIAPSKGVAGHAGVCRALSEQGAVAFEAPSLPQGTAADARWRSAVLLLALSDVVAIVGDGLGARRWMRVAAALGRPVATTAPGAERSGGSDLVVARHADDLLSLLSIDHPPPPPRGAVERLTRRRPD